MSINDIVQIRYWHDPGNGDQGYWQTTAQMPRGRAEKTAKYLDQATIIEIKGNENEIQN